MKTQNTKKILTFTAIASGMFFFSVANAQVVYTAVNPDSIIGCTSNNGGNSQCTDSFLLDLNHDGINDFKFIFHHKHTGHVCGTITNTIKVSPLGNNQVAADSIASDTIYPFAMNLNDTISSLLIWRASGQQQLRYYHIDFCMGDFTIINHGNWDDTTESYLGLKLKAGGQTYYGWIRIEVGESAANFTVKDYAYNTIPDQSILAGQTCPAPVHIMATGPDMFCEGDSLMLTASNDCGGLWSSLLWSTGATTSSIFVTAIGTYNVTATDSYGNFSSDSIVISPEFPQVNIILPYNNVICPGGTLTLTANYTTCGIPSFLWSTGATSSNIFIDTSGTYGVTITDLYGNSASASTTLTVFLDQPAAPFISFLFDSILFSSSVVNNQWFIDGTLIPGATSQSFIPQQSGIYQVQITDVYGCTAISQPYNFIANDIQNIDFENQIDIYPNPASYKITLSFSSTEKNIQITNTLGQIVLAKEINSEKEEVDVSEFPAGMYVVSARTPYRKADTKFLKQ